MTNNGISRLIKINTVVAEPSSLVMAEREPVQFINDTGRILNLRNRSNRRKTNNIRKLDLWVFSNFWHNEFPHL